MARTSILLLVALAVSVVANRHKEVDLGPDSVSEKEVSATDAEGDSKDDAGGESTSSDADAEGDNKDDTEASPAAEKAAGAQSTAATKSFGAVPADKSSKAAPASKSLPTVPTPKSASAENGAAFAKVSAAPLIAAFLALAAASA